MKQMVKKIMIVMLAAVMVSASVVMAGQQGESEGNSLGELIGNIIPEDFNLEDTLSGLKDTLSDALSGVTEKVGGAVEGVIGNITGEDGSLDIEKIGSAIGTLFGGAEAVTEEEVTEEIDAEAYYWECYDEVNDAIRRHIAEESAEFLEPGDESVYSLNNVAITGGEDGTLNILGYYMILNYDADGTDLLLKNGSGTIELLTLTLNEEGTHDVTDCQISEEGDDYLPSVEAMCETMGITMEDLTSALEFTDLTCILELDIFMEEHPEYERIEDQGELLTREELEAVVAELLDDIFSRLGLEDPSEESLAAE